MTREHEDVSYINELDGIRHIVSWRIEVEYTSTYPTWIFQNRFVYDSLICTNQTKEGARKKFCWAQMPEREPVNYTEIWLDYTLIWKI